MPLFADQGDVIENVPYRNPSIGPSVLSAVLDIPSRENTHGALIAHGGEPCFACGRGVGDDFFVQGAAILKTPRIFRGLQYPGQMVLRNFRQANMLASFAGEFVEQRLHYSGKAGFSDVVHAHAGNFQRQAVVVLLVLVNVASFPQCAQYTVSRGHGHLSLFTDVRQGEAAWMGEEQFQRIEVAAYV